MTIEDECFVGHGVVFINDRRPAAVNPDGSLKGRDDWTSSPPAWGAGPASAPAR